MKAEQLNREELLDRISTLYDNIESRVEEIEESGYILRRDARSKFRELQTTLPEDLNSLDDKELRTIYRKLMSINELKSSTLEGAEKSHYLYGDIEQMIDGLSPQMQKRVWDLYDRLYEENPNIASSFYKYDILREISTEVYKSRSKKKTLQELEQHLMRVVNLLGGESGLNVKTASNMIKFGITSEDLRTEFEEKYSHRSPIDMY